ncbi:MAG: Txe/YoeB family addiction module toxin [Eubacterium sp.]|nr:Txe/YoeB family addiction module toxin [Eubacterium sp.]
MIKCFTDKAWEDYQYWFKQDKKIVKRIHQLLKDIDSTPFSGIGKPEPLKYELSGTWSRRITEEHRLIYSCEDNKIIIYACRYHYGK